MSEEILEKIFEKAAKDRKFCKLLFRKREEALAEFELNEAEKNMLMSATDAQLNQMINQKRAWYNKEITPSNSSSNSTSSSSIITLGAGIVGLALLSSTCLGATCSVPHENDAQIILQHVAFAEKNYKKEFKCYADLKTLQKNNFLSDFSDYPYNVKVILKEDTFLAIATHKKRPDSRPQFEIGPDEKIRRLEPGKE